MRILLLFAPVLLLLTGCYATYPRPSDPNLLDTTIPIRPHTRPVDVYFPGEPLSDKPYRKVALVETYGKTPANRIASLKNKARAYGADALIIFTAGAQQVLETGINYYTRNQPFMQAYAVVYEENLAPEHFNQFAEVRVYNEDGTNLLEKRIKAVEYNYQGEIIREYGNDSTAHYELEKLYPQRSNIDFLVNGGGNWLETREYINGIMRVQNRKQVDAHTKWIRLASFNWNNEGQVIKIDLRERRLYDAQPTERYWIYPYYDEVGRLKEQHWYRMNRDKRIPYLIETHNYINDRLTHQEIERYDGEDMTPWIRIDYQPFPEDYHIKSEQNQ